MEWLLRSLFLLWTLLGVTAYTPLSDETLNSLPAAGSDFDIKTGSILAPILIPRVPGTPGSTAVQQHFVEWFRANLPNWTIEFQNSTSTTPATGDKQVPFANIIITRDPPWTQPGDVGRLALVAHYDSKLSPAGFIGATDSAAPCAMIMHAARSVDEALTKKWEAMQAEGSNGLEEEKGVQILLLDGEEAFVSWTNTESLYGARSLAETWEATPHAAMSTYHNTINSINLFFLLDLLGSASPNIPSYFQTTHWAYQSLARIELRMRSLGLLLTPDRPPFLPEADKPNTSFNAHWGVQDDHIPFMARGVEVLHIIPTPFPSVWHTMNDDGEHLDMPTVQDWAKMVTAFVGEWMDLEGYFPPKAQSEAHIRNRDELFLTNNIADLKSGMMRSPDEIFANWHGIIENDFFNTISSTFDLPGDDNYLYRAESFAMTLAKIQQQVDSGQLKYKYQSHGQQIEVSSADIQAYTSMFSSSTDTSKALNAFSSNAKKGSPRETVANYLKSRRISTSKVPKSKSHINPYFDLWAESCNMVSFLGPLPDPSYAHPINAKKTHPILPIFYHHFGCIVPTYEALWIISQLGEGVIDMASGNGYWTYMLRRMKVDVTAVDSMASEYRMMWIPDTVNVDGVQWLKKNGGGKGRILLMVYMVTAGTFTKRVLEAYKGDTIVVVGTQNANRYTGFSDCTVEEYFEREMGGWNMLCRIAMPSFAGKDEGMFVWSRR